MSWTFLGNGPVRWAIALGVFALATSLGWLLLQLLQRRVLSIARRTSLELDDLLVALLRRTKGLFIVLLAIRLAAGTLLLTERVRAGIESVLVVGFLAQAGFWGSALVAHLIDRYRRRQIGVDPGAATAIGALSFIGRAVVWLIAAMLILENLGIDVTALVTGLGIGGIAVALALQNVLSDLFASLAIVIDKPFVVGDFIVVGDAKGTVEFVGLKTTRVRALSGEQVVFSNSDLLSSRIRNFRRMTERRAVFQVGVTFDTPTAKLRSVPEILRTAVERHEATRFDRAHLGTMAASSLDFEVVYFVLSPDYNLFMDIQQAINLEILDRFAEAGIEIAYPTQTVLTRAI